MRGRTGSGRTRPSCRIRCAPSVLPGDRQPSNALPACALRAYGLIDRQETAARRVGTRPGGGDRILRRTVIGFRRGCPVKGTVRHTSVGLALLAVVVAIASWVPASDAAHATAAVG